MVVPVPTDLTLLTLAEAAHLVHRRKVSPLELTQACLKRIAQLNPKINAFITVTAEQALVQAKQAEEEIKQGQSANQGGACVWVSQTV